MDRKAASWFLCALAVMAAAVFVRTGPASFKGDDSKTREAYTDDASGIPYLTDMDSYYHVRLLDNYLEYGRLGDQVKGNGTAADGAAKAGKPIDGTAADGETEAGKPIDGMAADGAAKAAETTDGASADGAAKAGKTTDGASSDGQDWDTKSYYPEGRSAKYQPGIIWLSAAARRLSGKSGAAAQAIPYKLGAWFCALSALAACIVGWRIGGPAGGLSSGIFVACAPVYVSRTCYGRFDTDMFVVLMELLLILSATQALRASSMRARLLCAAGFSLSAGVYSLCWTPTYGMLFAGLTLAGGVLSCLLMLWKVPGKSAAAGLAALAAAGLMTAAALFFTSGAAVFSRIFSALFFTSSSGAKEGVLPNLLESISELRRAVFFPENFLMAWKGYVSGAQPSAVNGVGGAAVFLLSLIFLAWLFCSGFFGRRAGEGALPSGKNERGCRAGEGALQSRKKEKGRRAGEGVLQSRKKEGGRRTGEDALQSRKIEVGCRAGANASPAPSGGARLSEADCIIYFCVLGVWLAAGLYLAGKGVRFVEHLSIPTGLLAGGLIGLLFDKASAKPDGKRRLLCRAAAGLLFLAAALPLVTGAYAYASDMRPTASDASEKAMQYIRQNAREEDAVIASWWDMGYFYESASGHPCLWDGGTQNGARAIMVSKALTTDDLELSRRILLMLSHSGNAAAELLMEHTDARTAFGALFEALVLEKEEGLRLLCGRCGLSEDEAEKAWAMMRPDVPKETFLVLTYTMTRQIGWYEHYADWDFTGTQPLPASTLYSYTQEGTPLFRTQEGQEYLEGVRAREAIWRLFFSAEQTPCFTPAFEWHDGLEHVRVWRVEG